MQNSDHFTAKIIIKKEDGKTKKKKKVEHIRSVMNKRNLLSVRKKRANSDYGHTSVNLFKLRAMFFSCSAASSSRPCYRNRTKRSRELLQEDEQRETTRAKRQYNFCGCLHSTFIQHLKKKGNYKKKNYKQSENSDE